MAFAQVAGAVTTGVQQNTPALEATRALQEAELRKAIAEAERAELLAQLPPASSRPLEGKLDTRQFGAAGLVRAVDLANTLAVEVCAALPPDARILAILSEGPERG